MSLFLYKNKVCDQRIDILHDDILLFVTKFVLITSIKCYCDYRNIPGLPQNPAFCHLSLISCFELHSIKQFWYSLCCIFELLGVHFSCGYAVVRRDGKVVASSTCHVFLLATEASVFSSLVARLW
jgi:hypothetical protein